VGVARQEEVDHERVAGYNLAAMTEEDAGAAEKLWMEFVKETAQLNAQCTEDKVE
jgi:ribosomal protein L10